jgi:hypothetical protein
MAKHFSTDPNGEVVIFFARARGGREVVAQSVRALAEAVERSTQPRILPGAMARLPVTIDATQPGTEKGRNGKSSKEAAPPKEPELFEEPEGVADLGAEVDEVPADIENSRPKSKKFPTPKAVPGLNFTDNRALLSYVQEKSPDTDWDRYLVIAQWFKDSRATPSITPNHIYTAYRFLDANGIKWEIPKDGGLPFRDMKFKKSYFENGEKKNWWNINHIGETRVGQLPEKKQ